jgi:hypothetical protein
VVAGSLFTTASTVLAPGHGGQGRLVDLDDEPGAGHGLGHLGHVGGGPLGQ